MAWCSGWPGCLGVGELLEHSWFGWAIAELAESTSRKMVLRAKLGFVRQYLCSNLSFRYMWQKIAHVFTLDAKPIAIPYCWWSVDPVLQVFEETCHCLVWIDKLYECYCTFVFHSYWCFNACMYSYVPVSLFFSAIERCVLWIQPALHADMILSGWKCLSWGLASSGYRGRALPPKPKLNPRTDFALQEKNIFASPCVFVEVGGWASQGLGPLASILDPLELPLSHSVVQVVVRENTLFEGVRQSCFAEKQAREWSDVWTRLLEACHSSFFVHITFWWTVGVRSIWEYFFFCRYELVEPEPTGLFSSSVEWKTESKLFTLVVCKPLLLVTVKYVCSPSSLVVSKSWL